MLWGESALGLGQIAESARWLGQGLALCRTVGAQNGIAWCMAGLGSVAALLPIVSARSAASQPSAGAGDAALNGKFDAIFVDRVQRYPELASSLGLDKGANAPLKSKLDPRTGQHVCSESTFR